MTELQRNMAQVIPATGGLSHSKFRAPRNRRGRSDVEESAIGFLDGDFLERFLTLPHSSGTMDKIMKGISQAERLTLPREKIQKVLERLQSLHWKTGRIVWHVRVQLKICYGISDGSNAERSWVAISFTEGFEWARQQVDDSDQRDHSDKMKNLTDWQNGIPAFNVVCQSAVSWPCSTSASRCGAKKKPATSTR